MPPPRGPIHRDCSLGVTYCRLGERSSHSWFVLKYLLGYPAVFNFDGSWSESGNVVGVPDERPAATS
jgi:thiosulfate/3-mercaptopyruvate sulfurtransferase